MIKTIVALGLLASASAGANETWYRITDGRVENNRLVTVFIGISTPPATDGAYKTAVAKVFYNGNLMDGGFAADCNKKLISDDYKEGKSFENMQFRAPDNDAFKAAYKLICG